MKAQRIDGNAVAAEIRDEVKQQVAEVVKAGLTPCLAAVLVGDNPASRTYVGTKRKVCKEVGIKSVMKTPPADIPEDALLALIDELNADRAIHGILVQMPLPRHIDEQKVIERIDPAKDVDGFHPANVGRLVIGLDTLRPCTPAGIPELIVRSGLEIEGRHVAIIGRSNIVGKPMMNMLVQKAKGANATVTVCHSGTKDLATITRRADIVIAAIGRPHFVTAEMVKEGAVVIDVGINRVDDDSRPKGYRLVGDVDFDAVSEKASAITPVPGGVGPMTVAMLMVNTLKAAKAAAPRGHPSAA
ncbi:MAG: bifunctional methylenetetrahydrofolate dehydrogenase/methenyltetrahydrofolate cyclohydrolase FolD [Gammaproteobacteria bacterium]|nr:bifunctional methylenetetrahydrofolate dehydrogenase/methenyltetrahydrofolate cyclohydrolase FolD [Gammaproteobacteria bacterium]MBA3731019.1 bifunctional methylenetetrahydrofolate dehydrogenase/methenyltetrahydrofolate cyclohydrolase FolD [Gammaproteobacteria bacterium]